jgi:glycosyltransferase involved in cell wall biosynthesis
MTQSSPRIAIYLRMIYDCGVDRVMINLCNGFIQHGLKVDLALNTVGGKLLSQFPPAVRVIDLKAPHLSRSLPNIMRYLQQEQPTAVLTVGHYCAELAVLAKYLSRVPTRVVVSEHSNITKDAKSAIWRESKHWIRWGARLTYPWADGIVAVSHGVAQDLANAIGISEGKISVIYNPVFTPDILTKAKEPIDHPWFAPGQPPVILGVGRLEPQKDFPNLIRAFVKIRQIQPVRLMILGQGGQEQILRDLVCDLGLEDDVSLLGFVSNPFAYMAKSSVFALSSGWEGLPTVLIESMALGTPVVSTNCKDGPAELLDNGKYGPLVPVGDSDALAAAILQVLMSKRKPVPVPSDWLGQFTIESATQKYLDMLIR